jgi:putative ABC transport system permease protein
MGRPRELKGIAASLILVAVAIVVSRLRGLRLEKDLVVSVGRALVQLLVVAAVIQLVFSSLGLSGLLLLVMLAAAAWTSGRRLSGVPGATWRAACSITIAAITALAILFGLNVFSFEPRFLIPIAGMLIGNSMTATSLSGMRLRDELVDKTAEIEARLALGVPVAEALRNSMRRAAVIALVPTIDSTKNVGLIFLPGAFVGMILGGASPSEAARVQLIVLFMLLGAGALSALVSTNLVARACIGSGERLVVPKRVVE